MIASVYGMQQVLTFVRFGQYRSNASSYLRVQNHKRIRTIIIVGRLKFHRIGLSTIDGYRHLTFLLVNGLYMYESSQKTRVDKLFFLN